MFRLNSLCIQCNSNCKSGPSKLAVDCFETQDTELRLTAKCVPVKVRYMNVKLSLADTIINFSYFHEDKSVNSGIMLVN